MRSFLAHTYLSNPNAMFCFHIVALISIFLLINYLIFLFIRLCLGGRTWLSIMSIFLAYYILARKVVTIIIFPGCSYLYQRKLEVSFQESMGRMILDQIKEFSLCLDIFKSGGVDASMDDYSRT